MQLITYTTFRLYSIYIYTDYAYAENERKKNELEKSSRRTLYL